MPLKVEPHQELLRGFPSTAELLFYDPTALLKDKPGVVLLATDVTPVTLNSHSHELQMRYAGSC